MKTSEIRPRPEVLYAEELAWLKEEDTVQPRPPGWQLSPGSVLKFLIGGELDSGRKITPKYIGNRRIMEMAVATLATDRALLLLGVPGTAKSFVSELMAAAITRDSSLIVQGTAGTTEEALRYGWNYAELLSRGPSEQALVPSPVMRAMQKGSLVRIEELSRMGSDVQDSLISLLSEKSMVVPELDRQVTAVAGFNLIATANDRDRGVNELSSALKRRFNTVILPLPATLEEEVRIVDSRVRSLGHHLNLPAPKGLEEEIRSVVRIFRELREGLTEDGKTRIRPPSSVLSAAESIAVVTQGLSLASHFGGGELEPSDLAAGILGAVIRDPMQDKAIFAEYLQNVLKERDTELFVACRESMEQV